MRDEVVDGKLAHKWRLIKDTPTSKPELYDFLVDRETDDNIVAGKDATVASLSSSYEVWWDDVWEWFSKIAGCDFNSDSEFLEASVVVDPAAKDHPAVRGHGMSFKYSADWTNHDRSVTELPGFKVLLRVDESTFE